MNAETAKNGSGVHSVKLLGREAMEIGGVTDVISFDEQAVVLSTVCGTMTIEGASLHIHLLNTEQGLVALDGRVDAIGYSDADASQKDRKAGFLGKIFR